MEPRTILLVEDNADEAELARAALAESGLPHRLVVVEDGADALAYLLDAASAARRAPDLVLLDLKLPGIGGLEVLRRLRADRRTTLLPVVVLSSSLEDADVRASYALGANSYVRKPVDFAEFRRAAAQLGLYWLTLNESPPPERDE